MNFHSRNDQTATAAMQGNATTATTAMDACGGSPRWRTAPMTGTNRHMTAANSSAPGSAAYATASAIPATNPLWMSPSAAK